jgi:hypothetical protein
MKKMVFHYGKIAITIFAGGVTYIGLGQRFSAQPAAQPLSLTLTLLFAIVVLPATLTLFLPNHRLARWAGISHGLLLTLSKRDRAVLNWGRKSARKGSAVVSSDYPMITEAELREVLKRITKTP